MRDAVAALAVIVLLLGGCGGGGSRRRTAPESPAPAPRVVTTEARYPKTGEDCVRQLEQQARAVGARLVVREVRPQGRDYACSGELVAR